MANLNNRLFALILFVAVVSAAFAQNRFFSRLSSNDDVNYVYISKEMLSSESPSDISGDLSMFFDIMSGLESIEILTTQDVNIQEKALQKLPQCVDNLVCFVDNGCDADNGITRMYMVSKPDGMASGFLMIKQTGLTSDCEVGHNSALTAILLTGDIDAEKLKNLARQQ